jgi:Uma2 family endonuclease
MADAARSLLNDPVIEEHRARAPKGVRAEIVAGALLMSPAPKSGHLNAQGELIAKLLSQRALRLGGPPPRGWRFLLTPELHLGVGPDKLNPDLAGWRAARAPALSEYPITRVPDWVCEVLSPSTERSDRGTKLPLFGEHGATHAWLVDPDAHTLEVFRLSATGARAIGTYSGDALVRAEPFEEVELELGSLWE